jgi:hypothetical protein
MTNLKTPVPQFYPEKGLEIARRPRPTPLIPPPPRGRSYDVLRHDPLDDGWVDLDVDKLFDSIRVADAMVLEAEEDPDTGELMPSTRRSRLAQVVARCNGGES